MTDLRDHDDRSAWSRSRSQRSRSADPGDHDPPIYAITMGRNPHVGVAAVASLWLHMDFDWRLRRSQQEGTRRLV